MASLPPLVITPTPAPDELGRYELREQIGSGGMATVYRAWDPLLGVQRAIKVLYPEATNCPSLKKRFLAEARALSRLVHPNVLRIYDVGEDAGWCWYAMDLVEEGNLQEHLERFGPLPALDALGAVFQVLQALAFTHASGMIHRDVKPHNALMRADGTVLLADFGSARWEAAGLTRTGDVLGTVGYMPPEQRSDPRRANEATDVYAAGATLYALCTGRAPMGLFEGELDTVHLARLHPAVRDVIRGATRYRPEHRYPSARHMAQAIASAHDGILGAHGAASARRRWMARFDLLLDAVPRSTGTGAPARNAPSRDTAAPRSQAAPAPARALSSMPEPANTPIPARRPAKAQSTSGIVATVANAFTSALASAFGGGSAARVQPQGSWDGALEGMLPLRLEIESVRDGEVSGWAITTGLRGQVITRIEGRWEPASARMVLVETGHRPERGRYTVTLSGDTLQGTFEPLDPALASMRFTLRRAARADGERQSR